ncbi:hypothetical protein ACFQ14_03045 [Pseudahrensia aquimaris]|uniref:DSBA-like thioredoxin domain-containing protein n=1 Tax=Pseudahrensia aquimaris TaxID=744461 RepID=A0ABW3FDL1_9HYPH
MLTSQTPSVFKTVLIYGYDPICGWCYGAAPAVRAAAEIVPVHLVMAGLVVGERVGPAAAMESYVRQSSQRLEEVTGRRPSEAFYKWMRSPGAVAASGPPAVAVDAVMRQRPEAALAFAHAVTEAHYAEGMDPNDPSSYAPLLQEHAPGVSLPDIRDPALAERAFEEGKRIGISSFPTFAWQDDSGMRSLPTIYDPQEMQTMVKQLLG